jgi:hypothetical protein
VSRRLEGDSEDGAEQTDSKEAKTGEGGEAEAGCAHVGHRQDWRQSPYASEAEALAEQEDQGLAVIVDEEGRTRRKDD